MVCNGSVKREGLAGKLKVADMVLPVRSGAVRSRVALIDVSEHANRNTVAAIEDAASEKPQVIILDNIDFLSSESEQYAVADALNAARQKADEDATRLAQAEAEAKASADEIDAHRQLPRPVFEALADAGIFLMAVPRALGGGEIDLPTYVKVIDEIAQADASTASMTSSGVRNRRSLPLLASVVAMNSVTGDA